MKEKTSKRHDVIIAGIGGTGSMIIGQLLASAAVDQYDNVLWNPSITTARRGAPADCTVILSDEKIASPLLYNAQSVIMTESCRLKAFEDRVLPGGLVIIESSGKSENVKRNDVKTLEIHGVEVASKLGNALTRNMVLLGAYIEKVKPLPAESIGKEISNKFKNNSKVQELNLNAFREGGKIAADT
ncbi:MAG: 2-oxoacid:acceptor oxidoreductase family protein [Thermodesulfobacteriota bacterium]|nr:2-oxoacid:acceptor oxidoreductase family protein [Thermodesulfobacteriota bacterium]